MLTVLYFIAADNIKTEEVETDRVPVLDGVSGTGQIGTEKTQIEAASLFF